MLNVPVNLSRHLRNFKLTHYRLIRVLGTYGLPALPATEVVLYRAPGSLPRVADLIAEHIMHALEAEVGFSAETRACAEFHTVP